MDTAEKLRQIKQSFRLRMNGSTSRSMREKGVDYHINWGVSLPDLKQMAKEYGKDYDLAIALWKEDIRECKILATMIMPAEQRESIPMGFFWHAFISGVRLSDSCSINVSRQRT